MTVQEAEELRRQQERESARIRREMARRRNRRKYRRTADVRNWRYQRGAAESALLGDRVSDAPGLARGYDMLRRGLLSGQTAPSQPSIDPTELLRRRVAWLTSDSPQLAPNIKPNEANWIASTLGLGYGDNAARKWGLFRHGAEVRSPFATGKGSYSQVRYDLLGNPHIRLIGTEYASNPEAAMEKRAKSVASAKTAAANRDKMRQAALAALILGEKGQGFSQEAAGEYGPVALRAYRRGLRNRQKALSKQQLSRSAQFDRLVRSMIAAAPYVGARGDTSAGFNALSNFILNANAVDRPDLGALSNIYNARIKYMTENLKQKAETDQTRRAVLWNAYTALVSAGDLEMAKRIEQQLVAMGELPSPEKPKAKRNKEDERPKPLSAPPYPRGTIIGPYYAP